MAGFSEPRRSKGKRSTARAGLEPPPTTIPREHIVRVEADEQDHEPGGDDQLLASEEAPHVRARMPLPLGRGQPHQPPFPASQLRE